MAETNTSRHAQEDLKAIVAMLNAAGPHTESGSKMRVDLTVEVVWSAMRALQEDPLLTIAEACEVGLGEWDI